MSEAPFSFTVDVPEIHWEGAPCVATVRLGVVRLFTHDVSEIMRSGSPQRIEEARVATECAFAERLKRSLDHHHTLYGL
jgi:hypothetical protein